MKHFFLLIPLLLLTSLSLAQTRNLRVVNAPKENLLSDPKRKAVVVGMSDYINAPKLENTLNDVDSMSVALTHLGFEVTLLKNNDLKTLKSNLDNWFGSIENNDMAIFYFAGHGAEVVADNDKGNYLFPTDANPTSPADVPYEAVDIGWVLRKMDEQRVGMKLLILDACRNNPFTRGWHRGTGGGGLGDQAAPRGICIAFATSPGTEAIDGGAYNFKNGVFTHFLKDEIVKGGLSIDEIINNVTNDVSNLTHDQQVPYRSGTLSGNFYFIPKGNSLVADNPSPTPAPYNPPTPTPTPRSNGSAYNPDGIEMVYVEGSGSDIKATQGFYIGKYEVTQAQWKAIMGNNPSHFQGDNLPVEEVNWIDVQEFLSRLNARTNRNYRLPTEAEWEFAARGGTAQSFCPGGCDYSGGNNIDNVAWYDGNSGKRTHPVGTKQPNELGICDMSGNVWEWCQDWYDNSQKYRVSRGGSWGNNAGRCRVSFRDYYTQGLRNYGIGFRVVLP